MSWTKKVSVSYYSIEAAEEEYFNNFYDNMHLLLESNNTKGIFDSNDIDYQWELIEAIDVDVTKVFFFSLLKERTSWPFIITEEGERVELTIPNGSLGDISYGLFCPSHNFLLCFSGGGGGAATSFKKLLSQFSADGVVRLTPVFDESVKDKVMLWDYFKKLSLSFNMPSGDDVAQFVGTKLGSSIKLIDTLGGLKLDIAVSSGTGKDCLSSEIVKDTINESIFNDICTSITVRGSDYAGESYNQYDLKNAQIKYTEQLEIEGNYITDTDAKQLLLRALNDNWSLLVKSI